MYTITFIITSLKVEVTRITKEFPFIPRKGETVGFKNKDGEKIWTGVINVFTNFNTLEVEVAVDVFPNHVERLKSGLLE